MATVVVELSPEDEKRLKARTGERSASAAQSVDYVRQPAADGGAASGGTQPIQERGSATEGPPL